MSRQVWISLIAIAVIASPGLAVSQDPGERSRVHCDPAEPQNNCPGARCFCTEDTLEVTFDGDSQSVLELDSFVPNTEIEVTVVMDAHSGNPAMPGSGVQGWSYGLEHDGEFLQILSATLEGTDVDLRSQEFLSIPIKDILTCEGNPDPKCPNPRPTSGVISAVILSFTQPVSLEVRRNKILRVNYSLKSDPGPQGTVLRFVEHLKKAGSPPVDINITVNGVSKSPRLVIDGVVRRVDQKFRRGDIDGSGRISIGDVVNVLLSAIGAIPRRVACNDLYDADDDGRLSVVDAIPLLSFLYQRGPALPEPFQACGLDPTQEALGCAESSCP